MPNRVIILAGATKAGKTKTLERVTKRSDHVRGVRGKYFCSYKGKEVCISTSSCQERNRFCCVQKVIECIDRVISRCDSEGCAILIMPFTMWTNRQRELNTDCIIKPIDHLKTKGLKVHLVYLRKEPAHGINLMNSLMSNLYADIIKSVKDDEERQADELWKILIKEDP